MITVISETSNMSRQQGMEVKSICVANREDIYDQEGQQCQTFSKMAKARYYARKIHKKYNTEDIVHV